MKRKLLKVRNYIFYSKHLSEIDKYIKMKKIKRDSKEWFLLQAEKKQIKEHYQQGG